MALLKVDWKDISTSLSITSVTIAGIGASLPDPYSKVALGISVGLANAAVIAMKHEAST